MSPFLPLTARSQQEFCESVTMLDFSRTLTWLALLVALVLCVGCGGTARSPLKLRRPSHDRNWDPAFAVLPNAQRAGSLIRVRNVRDFRYADADIFVPHYEDRVYDLAQLQSVDYIVVPFQHAPDLAHTMLSFGFADGQQLVVSVEARREAGEKFSALAGLVSNYEIMYVCADERDAISLRAVHRDDDVYIYRTRANPAQAQAMFVDVMNRVQEIHERPEFYHTLTNNCTTNIRQHIEQIAPGKVPWGWSVLLPGRSDEYAYQLGLLDTSLPFAETRRHANVTQLATQYHSHADFSQRIRRR